MGRENEFLRGRLRSDHSRIGVRRICSLHRDCSLNGDRFSGNLEDGIDNRVGVDSEMGMALTKEFRGGGSTGSLPPQYGGGGGDPSGGNRPNYAERLRRARMGLAVGLTPVAMLFVSFS